MSIDISCKVANFPLFLIVAKVEINFHFFISLSSLLNLFEINKQIEYMNIEGGAKGVVFSLVMSLIKGLGAKAIGIIVKGLILGVVFALVLTPLIFSWGEFSKLRFLISVVFFFAAIAGVVVVYVLHRAPEIIDPSIDHTIASNYDYLQSKVGAFLKR